MQLQRPVADLPPLWRSLLTGLWRGARFGAIVAIGVMLVCAGVGWFIMLASPQIRQGQIGAPAEIAKALAGTVAGMAVGTCWGALVGGIIMAVAALVRRLRDSV